MSLSLRPVHPGSRREAVRQRLSGRFRPRLELLEDRTLLSFAGPLDFSVSSGPQFVATADFNGDGKLDLVTANPSSGVNVLLGDGTGHFTAVPGSPFVTGDRPQAVAVGDFTGSGRQDLAVANFGSTVAILLGNGNGTFQFPVQNFVDADPVRVITGDFARNGRLDLAVANHIGADVSVLLGNGNGTFQPRVNIPIGSLVDDIAVGDLTGNGILDLVTANGDDTISVLMGNGNGTFRPPVRFNTAGAADRIALADFTGNGRLDVAVANGPERTVSILLGNGDGTFQTPMLFPTGGNAQALTVADFNGDGALDIATANSTDNDGSLLLGNGNGTFQAPVNFATGRNPVWVTAADFTGNGQPDLAVANFLDSTVSVLINTFPMTSRNAGFVTKLYRDVLNRAPDAAGFTGFVNALNTGQATRASVAQVFLTSFEYRTDVVENLYEKLLLRPADPNGLAAWTSFLARGGTTAQLEAMILGSDEYFARRGNFSTTGFLDAVYSDILGRAPDPAGLASWSQLINAQQGIAQVRVQVAFGIVTSLEGDTVQVESDFALFLHRPADAVGLAGFVAALLRGVTNEQVFAVILESPEYFQS